MTEGWLHRRLPAKRWDELKRPRWHAAGLGIHDRLRFSWQTKTMRTAACGCRGLPLGRAAIHGLFWTWMTLAVGACGCDISAGHPGSELGVETARQRATTQQDASTGWLASGDVLRVRAASINDKVVGSLPGASTPRPAKDQETLPWLQWASVKAANARANEQDQEYGLATRPQAGMPAEKPRLGLDDFLTFSANFDAGYRKTQFFDDDHRSLLFQWDGRAELWLPPFRKQFAWGPYLRLAGITSDTTEVWENNWSARPGFGIQAYPFSLKPFREPDNLVGRILGPTRLFYEYNCVHYRGGEPWWRPDRLIRAGAEYWRERSVNNTDKPVWHEAWWGLTWQETDEWNQDVRNVIFGASARVGARIPKAGILSMFSPYLVAESSLTENRESWWENRLLLGGGIRFAPRLKDRKWLSRVVLFAEYVAVADYYRQSAPSSVPDYDFRVGISISIGEWFSRFD